MIHLRIALILLFFGCCKSFALNNNNSGGGGDPCGCKEKRDGYIEQAKKDAGAVYGKGTKEYKEFMKEVHKAARKGYAKCKKECDEDDDDST